MSDTAPPEGGPKLGTDGAGSSWVEKEVAAAAGEHNPAGPT